MAVHPRTIRTVRSLTAGSRLRHVAAVQSPSFGTISVFLAATVVLGLTALFFLWQSGTGLKSEYQIQQLQVRLSSLQSAQIQLESQAAELQQKSLQLAGRYHMSLYNAAPQRSITATLPTAAAPSVASAQSAAAMQAPIRLSTTSAATESWQQQLWTAFYNAFH